eukprot:249007-Chlamydomonas_euryale.AAC.1
MSPAHAPLALRQLQSAGHCSCAHAHARHALACWIASCYVATYTDVTYALLCASIAACFSWTALNSASFCAFCARPSCCDSG